MRLPRVEVIRDNPTTFVEVRWLRQLLWLTLNPLGIGLTHDWPCEGSCCEDIREAALRDQVVRWYLGKRFRIAWKPFEISLARLEKRHGP